MFVLSDSQNKKKNVNSQEFEDNPNQHYIYWSQSSMIIADVDNCKKHFSGIACVCSFCTHCIAFLVCTSRIGANRNDRRMYRTCRYASRNDGHPEQLGRHFALGEQDSARSTAAGYRNVINSSSYLVSIGSCGKKLHSDNNHSPHFVWGIRWSRIDDIVYAPHANKLKRVEKTENTAIHDIILIPRGL